MQRFTAKEIKPSPGENKPTIIKTEDGSSLSGFQASLKTMKPGTVFECETEIKRGYVNIKGDPIIIQEGNGQVSQFTENVYKKEDPAKTASIETMNAITNIMTAYLKLQELATSGMVDGPGPNLQDLWDRSLAWCDSRIAPPAHKVEITSVGDKERTQVDTGAGKMEKVNGGPPFENAGKFWSAAKERWGKSQSEFVVILEINSAKDITNFDLAWDLLTHKLG